MKMSNTRHTANGERTPEDLERWTQSRRRLHPQQLTRRQHRPHELSHSQHIGRREGTEPRSDVLLQNSQVSRRKETVREQEDLVYQRNQLKKRQQLRLEIQQQREQQRHQHQQKQQQRVHSRQEQTQAQQVSQRRLNQIQQQQQVQQRNKEHIGRNQRQTKRVHHQFPQSRTKMASVNTFEVVYLGSAVLSQQSSTGLGATQKPLLELYSHYRTSGTSRIQRKFLEVTPDGYTLSYKEDPDGKIVNESYPVAAMQYTDAVRLNIVKGTGKKFKAAFEPLDPETNMNVSKLYFSLDKKKHFLAKIVHPAIFVSVLRRAVGPRALDCHAFVCSTTETAIKLSRSTNYIIRQFQNEDDDDTTVFKYKPYESSQQQAARRELPLDQMNLQQEFFMEPVNDSFFVSDDHQKNLASSDIWRPATNMRDPVGVRGGVEMNVHGRSKSVDLVHEHYDSRLHRRSHTAVEGLQDKSDFRTGHDSRLWFNNVDNNETVEGSLMKRPRPLNKPVAKVQPHQLGGVKVLPTPVDLIKKRRNSETDDYNGQGKQPVYRFERQEFRGSQASNSPPRRHSTHDSNWHYATKLPDFSSPVDHETAYDSPEFQNSAVKDMEIASALKNLRMGHEQNRYRGNDFESSLGYLP